MATRGAIVLDNTIVEEAGQLQGTVRFRDRDGADSIPTTAEYMVYDLDHNRTITGWTSLGTPAADMDFTLDRSDLTLEGRTISDRFTGPLFRRILTIVADRGLDTQVVLTRKFRIKNVPAVEL